MNCFSDAHKSHQDFVIRKEEEISRFENPLVNKNMAIYIFLCFLLEGGGGSVRMQPIPKHVNPDKEREREGVSQKNMASSKLLTQEFHKH